MLYHIYANRQVPESYVSNWYLMKTYRKSYAPDINPMLGPNVCLVDRDVDPILPPIPNKQSGKPRKLRKRGLDENELNESVKVTRKGYDICYGNYGQKGHHARSCCQPNNPNRKKYAKRVRILFKFIARITRFDFVR
jgi:hypothetical protein